MPPLGEWGLAPGLSMAFSASAGWRGKPDGVALTAQPARLVQVERRWGGMPGTRVSNASTKVTGSTEHGLFSKHA